MGADPAAVESFLLPAAPATHAIRGKANRARQTRRCLQCEDTPPRPPRRRPLSLPVTGRRASLDILTLSTVGQPRFPALPSNPNPLTKLPLVEVCEAGTL